MEYFHWQFSWIQIIKNVVKDFNEKYTASPKNWQQMFQGIKNESVQKFALEITEMIEEPFMKKIYKDSTPIHLLFRSQRFSNVFNEIELLQIVKNILGTLKNGEDKNLKDDYRRDTPLHLVVEIKNRAVFQEIVSICSDLAPQNINGETPLHYAAGKGNLPASEYLFNNVKDKNPATKYLRRTPLHIAAGRGHLEVYQMMIKHPKIKKNPMDSKGQTPLHLAAKNGHFQMCKFIIENVSEANLIDNNGHTPLQLATKNGRSSIVNLLIEKLSKKRRLV